MAGEVDKTKGKVKETVGVATDDAKLVREGGADRDKGDLKQAGEKIKDKAEDVKDKL